MSRNNSTVTPPTEDQMRQADLEWAAARAAACSIDGCDGTMHDPNAEPDAWAHSLPDAKFDNGNVTIGVWSLNGRYHSDIEFEGIGTYSAADLREAADRYEAFPALLRSKAAELDALNQ